MEYIYEAQINITNNHNKTKTDKQLFNIVDHII